MTRCLDHVVYGLYTNYNASNRLMKSLAYVDTSLLRNASKHRRSCRLRGARNGGWRFITTFESENSERPTPYRYNLGDRKIPDLQIRRDNHLIIIKDLGKKSTCCSVAMRVLCLHGKGTSASILEAQTG
jgi:hypothetical protein